MDKVYVLSIDNTYIFCFRIFVDCIFLFKFKLIRCYNIYFHLLSTYIVTTL